MAVEILCLNFDGPGDRKRGAICAMKEYSGTNYPKWGKKECLPSFYFVRVKDASIKDLEFLARGMQYSEPGPEEDSPLSLWFRSRFLLSTEDISGQTSLSMSNEGIIELSLAELKKCVRCQKKARLLTTQECDAAISASLQDNDPIKAIDG